MTAAQVRLVQMLRDRDGEEEYWPLVNDWVRDSGPEKSLALRNITRTIGALLRAKVIEIDADSGMVRLLPS